jgi:hypothetical protein
MAKAPKASALALPGTTTGALVKLTEHDWMDENNSPDPDLVTCSADIKFNGALWTEGTNVRITYARNASEAMQQTIVVAAVNAKLHEREPGVDLTKANVMIGGILK